MSKRNGSAVTRTNRRFRFFEGDSSYEIIISLRK